MASVFPPPPTYAEPTIVDPQTGKAQFNPIWLKWFLDFAQILSAVGGANGSVNHNSLAGLQGGITNQFYHLKQADFTAVETLIAIVGINAVITTPSLTIGGVQGSMTFTSGILTARTQAT